MRPLLFHAGLAALASVLALDIAAVPPRFSKDAQFYVQEGPLWAAGNVTYGGSLVGNRHLVVLAYHLPRLILWDSIDALSVTLGAIFFCYALALGALAARSAGCNGTSFVAAAAAMLAAFLVPPWTVPASDNLFLLVIMVASLLYVVLLQSSRAGQAARRVMALGAWCGFSTGVRSEGLLVFIACAVTLIAPLPAWPRLRQRGAGVLLGSVCFVLSSAAQSALFPVWTGVAKPGQLSGFFLFYETAGRALDPSAGPASARLRALLESANEELVAAGMFGVVSPRFRVTGMVYEQGGGQAVSELFQRAGIESLIAHPGRAIGATWASIRSYLTVPEGVFRIDRRGGDVRREETRRRLAEIDEIRVRTSSLFGRDAHWRVAALAEGAPAYRFDWPHPTGNPPA